MKRMSILIILAIFLMIGCPWLTVTFAGGAGMAICFLLFFVANPLFAVVSGIFAGKNMKQLWSLPIIIAGLYLAGVWLFFEMGEPAFLLYGSCYLVIGVLTMLVSAFVKNRKFIEKN